MISPIVVMKFGGTSIEDAQAFERVTRIIGAQQHVRPVIVVSAMSRVTDALVSSFQLAAEGAPDVAAQSLDDPFKRHLNIAQSLLQMNAYRDYRAALEIAGREINELLALVADTHAHMHPALQDRVISYGEQLSATLLTFLMVEKKLPARHVDARRCIITDDAHGCCAPLPDLTMLNSRRELKPIIEASEIPVLGGFIAATESELPTTLGRNGSDYTAALVGAALNASEIQIWTDVTGVLTADPHLVENPRTVSRMSYEEATEVSRLGSKVIYTQAIQPAAAQNIPLRICNSRAPHESGTLICSQKEVSPGIVKSIAHKPGLALIRIWARPPSGTYEFPEALFDALKRHRISVDAVGLSEASVSLVLDEKGASAALLEEMQRLGSVEVQRGRALISVIGEGLHIKRGVTARALGALRDMSVCLISNGGSDSTLMLLLDQERSIEAVRRLHQAFFEEVEAGAKEAPAETLELLNQFPATYDSVQ
jgi:aspartate kinase